MKIPKRALSHTELRLYARRAGVRNFRGVFNRDALPRGGAKGRVERAVVNMDDKKGPGTHYVCYALRRGGGGVIVRYFDSYGLRPPVELVRYWRGSDPRRRIRVEYNVHRIQRYDTRECGRLCLLFLKADSEGLI
jgi:hypothetical protein